MKQAELQVKQQEQQRKAQKDQADVMLQKEELQLRKAKEASNAMLEAEKLKIDQAELAIEAEVKGVQLEQSSRANRDKMTLEAARMMQSQNTRKPNKE
jgi:hypothetical protein